MSPPIAYSLPTFSSSLPAYPTGAHANRILSDGNQTNIQETAEPNEFGSFERLPEGSEAFSAVFGEMAQLQGPGESKHSEKNAQRGEMDEKTQIKGGSPRRVRKDMQKLQFALENLQVRSSPSSFRKRATSASIHRKILKPTREIPSSTHSTPALRYIILMESAFTILSYSVFA